MGTKTFYKSKLFWVGVASLIFWGITDTQVDANQTAQMLVYVGYAETILKIVLRLFGTKTDLTLT